MDNDVVRRAGMPFIQCAEKVPVQLGMRRDRRSNAGINGVIRTLRIGNDMRIQSRRQNRLQSSGMGPVNQKQPAFEFVRLQVTLDLSNQFVMHTRSNQIIE